jgi:hypothetical protein
MSPQPYQDLERDVEVSMPRPPELPALGPACEVCGDDWELGIRPCWTAERGWWTGTRCVDGRACQTRMAAPPQPMQPTSSTAADGDDDAWHF